jgi:hypothetical protein
VSLDSEGQEKRLGENHYSWDLSKDLSREYIPDEIIRCLRFTITSTKKEMKHIPRFIEFFKEESIVRVKFSQLPLRLRNVIGKRNDMYLNGQKIIKLLLMALLELKDQGLRVFNIEPSSIYLSNDFS